MYKKLFKNIVAIISAIGIVSLGSGPTVFASNTNDLAVEDLENEYRESLVELPPSLGNFSLAQTYGAYAPGKNTDVHDLSLSAYNFQIAKMKKRAYSSKWITGGSRIKIEVSRWKLVENKGGAINNKLLVTIFDTNDKEVTSKTIEIKDGGGDVRFNGLKTLKNYYVRFDVPETGNLLLNEQNKSD